MKSDRWFLLACLYFCAQGATTVYAQGASDTHTQTASASAPTVAANAGSAAAHSRDNAIRLRFADTDVSEVLQAIGLRTHDNIVFPAQLKKPISLNVSATSTADALSYVSAAAGLTFRQVGHTYIIAPPSDLRQALEPFGEHTRVTLSILTPADAVKMVEGAFPYVTARPAGNQVLLIGAPDDLAQAQALLADQDKPNATDPMVSDVVVLRYASASQVATMVKNIYSDVKAEAVGTADKVGGVIGLAGPRSRIALAKDAIRTADLPNGPQDSDKEYRVYSIKYSSAPVLLDFLKEAARGVTVLMGPDNYSPPAASFNPISGSSLSSSSGSSSGGSSGGTGGGTSGGSSGGTGGGNSGGAALGTTSVNPTNTAIGRPGSRARVLVLHGLPADLDAATRLLEQVDTQPRQIMVEVKVVDTSPEQAEELGFTWNWTRFGFYEAPVGTHISGSTGGIAGDFTDFFTKGAGFGQLSRVPWSFSSILKAMVTRNEAKILADPRVQVLENDDASIFIGQTIRTQLSQSSVSGTTLQVAEFPVGIILLVRPRINSDGKITMRVHPVVSTVDSINADGLPQTSSREAETTVMVQDGETMVIGGLIQDQMSKVVTEVPFLSKIPLIGELFRNRSTDHRHSDVLVFITPHIVK